MTQKQISVLLKGYTDGFTVDCLPREYQSAYWHVLNDNTINSETIPSAHRWLRWYLNPNATGRP